MTLSLAIPDVLTNKLDRVHTALPQVLLDGSAVEAHRQAMLSVADVRVLMGHQSRWETEDFLATHEACPGTTAAEVTKDRRQLKELLAR